VTLLVFKISFMQNLAPIVLFVYNRPDHALRTIEALKKNNLAKESELFIFCDGPKNENGLSKINEVHKVIDLVDGFKNVVVKKAALNKGLANSVISGVGEIVEKYGKVIVLEDDVVTATCFLQFMNDALDFYQHDKRIFTVTGFNFANYKKPQNYFHDIFFIKGRSSSWGWAIWKDRWQKIDFLVKDYDKIASDKKMQKEFTKSGDNLFCMLKDQMTGKIDTWDVQTSYAMFKAGASCVFPIKTMVKNIGFDSSGAHCHADQSMSDFSFDNNQKVQLVGIDDAINNDSAAKNFLKFVQDKYRDKIFSKKTFYKIKYVLIGLLLAKILDFLFSL